MDRAISMIHTLCPTVMKLTPRHLNVHGLNFAKVRMFGWLMCNGDPITRCPFYRNITIQLFK